MNLVKKGIEYLWLHLWKYKANERQHRRLVRQLSRHAPVKVVFFAIDVALWRYQHLYELMSADSRFQPVIVLSPCPGRKQREQDAARLRRFFDGKDIPYIDYHEGEQPYDVKSSVNPDIVFYPQPYEHLLCPEHDCRNFYDRLVCYASYYFPIGTQWAYNLHFSNRAWRMYYSLPYQIDLAQQKAFNHGRNARMVGYANADDFLQGQHLDAWKKMGDGQPRKRLIWAPHFSIQSEQHMLPPRSNFLWMADLMVDIAKKYKDQLQIAFKPHPTLLSRLYEHPEWGRERTDAYYHQWEVMENTQLETGQYIDLFMTSDAMVHDSASFVAEYHYSQKPVMFVVRDLSAVTTDVSPVGQAAYDACYMGQTESDIHHFVNSVVLGNDDPLKARREAFFHDHLLPPNHISVAQNILNDIIQSLHLSH